MEMKEASSSGVKVKKVHIQKFRKLYDVVIDLGSKITLIAGQNGTAKSTLLGIIAQPFSFGERKKGDSVYTENYHGLDLREHKTLMGKPFNTEYSHVFKMSHEYDKPRELEYKLFIEGECVNIECDNLKNGLRVRSETREETNKSPMRFVAGESRLRGEGNFPHPVLYLGLNRLYPLAVCDHKISSKIDLTPEETSWYNTNHNEVLLIKEDDSSVENVSTKASAKNTYLGHKTKDYDSGGCSAGQDNLGQILTAILSFKHLKNRLKDKYQGGILLIDELDATFHPLAQEKVLKLLIEAAIDYNLQIIATTHSLFLLEKACKSQYAPDTKIIYLKKEDNNIVNSGLCSYEEIADNLKVTSTRRKVDDSKKISVLLEDKVANNMFNWIIGKHLKDFIKVIPGSVSGNIITQIASLKMTELKKILFVIDGDIDYEISSRQRNLLKLPGGKCPEKLLYLHLCNLSDLDPIWEKSKMHAYSKQVCFRDHLNYREENSSEDFKKWFNSQSKYFGPSYRIAFQSWIEAHKPECEIFCRDFIKALEKMLNEELPMEVKEKCLGKFVSLAKTVKQKKKNIKKTKEKNIKKIKHKKNKKFQAEEIDVEWVTIQPEFGF